MRYKGYYFDEETGFYYCKSRYYVPEWCRWLNADSPAYLKPYSATGNNLFAYCENNPVMYMDESGRLLRLAALVGLIITGIVALTGCASKESDEFEYHVVSDGNSKESGKINYSIEGPEGEPSIRIYDSHEIRSEAQKREILEYIINTDEGKLKGLSENNIDYYIDEWTVHNAAEKHSFFAWVYKRFALGEDVTVADVKKSASHVDLNTDDPNADFYKRIGWMLRIIF